MLTTAAEPLRQNASIARLPWCTAAGAWPCQYSLDQSGSLHLRLTPAMATVLRSGNRSKRPIRIARPKLRPRFTRDLIVRFSSPVLGETGSSPVAAANSASSSGLKVVRNLEGDLDEALQLGLVDRVRWGAVLRVLAVVVLLAVIIDQVEVGVDGVGRMCVSPGSGSFRG